MEKKFDYKEAMARLEAIAAKIEDPSTGLDEIDAYVRQSDELIAGCREYLRTVRETVEDLDK